LLTHSLWVLLYFYFALQAFGFGMALNLFAIKKEAN